MQNADLLLHLPQPYGPPDPIAIRNILLATDFSDCSKRALGYAAGNRQPLWVAFTPFSLH
jgi:hypothetical protein